MQHLNKDKLGRFVTQQLSHTVITAVILAALFFGAAQVGALDNVLAPAGAATGTSFTTVNYQGRLADAGGTPIDNPNPGIGMTFALYDVQTGDTALWSETHANVPISEGLFSVKLGSVNALSTDLLNGDRWLGIQVGNDPEMAPREKLAAVPYAMMAGQAETAIAATNNFTIPGKLQVKDSVMIGQSSQEDVRFMVSDNVKFYSGRKISDNYTIGDASSQLYEVFGAQSCPQPSGGPTTGCSGMGFVSGAHQVSPVIWIYAYGGRNQFRIIRRGWDTEIAKNPTLFSVDTSGNGYFAGNVTQGAIVERNLLTEDEKHHQVVSRFAKGDLLCWNSSAERLAQCTESASPLIIAVADANGKPIVLGAEPVKVLGPVKPGDLLVASNTPGYAVAWSQTAEGDPPVGVVIAKALAPFKGERGLIKAMILGR